MQIYLLLSVASNSLHQRHAFLQFELYTLALRKMIPSAWTAHMAIDFFRNAVKNLASRHGQPGGGHHDHRLSGSEQLLMGDSIASPADVRFSATTRQSCSPPMSWGAPGNDMFDNVLEWPIPKYVPPPFFLQRSE